MSGNNGKKALHVATFSGWYRFEQDGKEFKQTKRDLTYWTLTCMSVDPANPQKIYAGSEHSGLFYTRKRRRRLEARRTEHAKDDAVLGVGARWRRDGRNHSVGGVSQQKRRMGRIGRCARQQRRREFSAQPGAAIAHALSHLRSRRTVARLYAGIEVGGMLVSDDSGYSWKPANEGLTDMDVHEMLASEANPGMVYLACGEACFRSPDRAGSLGKYFAQDS